MCGGALPSSQIDAAREALRGYAWRDEEHRVVFEALARARNVHLIPLREQLPAHATRMGFPDVDWPLYFTADSHHRAPQDFDLQESLQKLQRLAAER